MYFTITIKNQLHIYEFDLKRVVTFAKAAPSTPSSPGGLCWEEVRGDKKGEGRKRLQENAFVQLKRDWQNINF
jgi:hypothetical protein